MTTTQAAAHTFTGLMIARLGLGTFEAAFGGAVVLYFCELWNFQYVIARFDVFNSFLLYQGRVRYSHRILVRVCSRRRGIWGAHRLRDSTCQGVDCELEVAFSVGGMFCQTECKSCTNVVPSRAHQQYS